MIRTAPVQRYLDGLRPSRDPLLAEIEQVAARDGVPIAEWETARLLHTLVTALRPRLIVEVGSAIGYSTIQMARALEGDGRIVTLERDPVRSSQARGFFARDPAGARIELVEGDALESLQRLDGPFDLAFVDAAEREMRRHLQALDGRLAPRAVLAIDRLLPAGVVADAVARDLVSSPQWSFTVLPVGNGVGLGCRRGTLTP